MQLREGVLLRASDVTLLSFVCQRVCMSLYMLVRVCMVGIFYGYAAESCCSVNVWAAHQLLEISPWWHRRLDSLARPCAWGPRLHLLQWWLAQAQGWLVYPFVHASTMHFSWFCLICMPFGTAGYGSSVVRERLARRRLFPRAPFLLSLSLQGCAQLGFKFFPHLRGIAAAVAACFFNYHDSVNISFVGVLVLAGATLSPACFLCSTVPLCAPSRWMDIASCQLAMFF